jgi:arylsulfatase
MSRSRPNVLFITVDSLRADYVGISDEDPTRESLTPHFDRLGKRSTIFKHAIAQSVHTAPSLRSMMSGNYPSRYGDWFYVVSPERPMLAEILKRHGYNTHGFHSNPYVSRHYGFDRGFDVFDDHLPTSTRRRKTLRMFAQLKALLTEPYENARTITDQVLGAVERADRPFFVWAHYMDVHGPYIAKQGQKTLNRVRAALLWKKAMQHPERIGSDERDELIRNYKQEITYMDRHLGEVLARVNLDETLVVFTADHGDLLGEHDLYGHSSMFYKGAVHVPLLVSMPGVTAGAPREVDVPVRLIDVVPTICRLLDLDTDAEFEGSSLAELITGADSDYRAETIVSEMSRRQLCLRRDEWKMIVNYKKNVKELYNLAADPHEKVDVLEREPERAREMESLVQEHVNRVQSDAHQEEVTHEAEIKDRLRALGYME